ncbi:MAG: GNAT family N-acetyltransferase [Ruminococcaceae bacterium]|nr:GNAT family N-acetyltransferase [Oscillospiraceae bacterium]
MVKIREALRADSNAIFALICALAEYEKMSDLVTAAKSDLEALLFDSGVGHCLVAEDGGAIVGFALWFYNLSTFKCRKGIYLEDLFVMPERRGEGIGKALLHTLAKIAKAENCGRLEWCCLDWNTPSLEFYRSMGAETLDEWVHLRVDERKFEQFINT